MLMLASYIVKFQVKPTTLLIPYRLDDALLQGRAGSGEFETPYQLLVRPAVEFVYDKGKEKVLALKCLDGGEGVRLRYVGEDDMDMDGLDGDGGGRGQLGRLMRAGGMVDLESRISVSLLSNVDCKGNGGLTVG